MSMKTSFKTKDKILEILSEKAEAVSGEELGTKLGVSRAAVWKAIKTLRESGYSIEGTTNSGYKLITEDVLSEERIRAFYAEYFPGGDFGTVECFKVIDSTNTYAKKLLSESGNLRGEYGSLTEAGKKLNKSLFAAESQNAGKGRLGRSFCSPAKTGLYFSLIYAPENGITNPAKLTAYAAVAVCRVLKKLFGITPGIKWINDIFAGGKKICGILAEGFTNFETGSIEAAIIGIGINIHTNPEAFTGKLAEIAGSLEDCLNPSVNDESSFNADRSQIAALISGTFFQLFEEDSSLVMDEYRSLSFLTGKTITVHPIIDDEKSTYRATVIGIDDNAGLIVKTENGETKTLSSGEVSLRSEAY